MLLVCEPSCMLIRILKNLNILIMTMLRPSNVAFLYSKSIALRFTFLYACKMHFVFITW